MQPPTTPDLYKFAQGKSQK